MRFYLSAGVWARLQGDRVQGEMLWARQACTEVTDRLLAALDADERRHLLVPIEESDSAVEDSQSRGIAVVTRELAGRGYDHGRYLDIICLDGAGHDAFDVIGGELAERIASGTETSAECVMRVLAKWRRFWGQTPKNLLSRDAQVGLFAELWFLAFWLIPKRGISAARDWRGPFGSRHDFEWANRSVEVKGTTSTRGPIHHVNGMDQLNDPEQGDLLMFSARIREEAGASNTLPGMVAACRVLLSTDSEVLTYFDLALDRSGYSPLHEEDYARTHWRLVEEQLYAVTDDFPRLSSSRLIDGLSPGIERVGYDINLSVCQHLCIARRPSDSFDL
jgi:hypothetical protein